MTPQALWPRLSYNVITTSPKIAKENEWATVERETRNDLIFVTENHKCTQIFQFLFLFFVFFFDIAGLKQNAHIYNLPMGVNGIILLFKTHSRTFTNVLLETMLLLQCAYPLAPSFIYSILFKILLAG